MTNNLDQLKSELLKEFEDFYEDLMFELDILDSYEGSHEQKIRNWLSSALDRVVEKTAEAVLTEAIAIFDKLPEEEQMTKNPVILELKVLREKWLGRGK